MGTNGNETLSRRGFLTGIGAGAMAATTAASLSGPGESHAADAPKAAGDGEIRLGSVSWNFGSIVAGPPWTGEIDAAAAIGFEGIEVICASPGHLDATVAEPHLSDLLRQLDRRKMTISQFVLFQPLVADLGNPDAEKRKRTLDVFAKACKVAVKVRAPMINIVAPWPTVYRKEGWGYLPRYYSPGAKNPQPKFQFDVPRDFDWEKAWAGFVDVMKQATAAAKAEDLRFSLENHTHTFVRGVDAFLRLWDQVHDPALGMNLDIGWLALEREYPVVGVYKAARHLMNVHLRDMDGIASHFPAPGTGCLDFPGIVMALRDVGFSGFMSFEQDGVPDMKQALKRGKEIFDRLLAMSRDELEAERKRS